jgi:4-hydroxy-3-methylbut-2-enyl diphosphate reductase
MEDVVVFAALAWEAGVVLDGLQGVESLAQRTWHGFLGDGASVRVLQMGVGPVRAARAAETAPPAALYVSIGCAGSLVGGLHSGDVIVGEQVVCLDGRASVERTMSLTADGITGWAAMRDVPLRCGVVASSPVVLATGEQKVRAARAGALVVDMECGGLAAVAQARGVPTAALKVVLDELGDDVAVPHPDVIDLETGDLRRGRAVAAVLARPRAWGSTLRLARQQRLAERRLRAVVAQLFSAGLDGLGVGGRDARVSAPL